MGRERLQVFLSEFRLRILGSIQEAFVGDGVALGALGDGSWADTIRGVGDDAEPPDREC